MWRIRYWDQVYENSRSREVLAARFVCVPNKQDGDGYLTLLEHGNGAALYGAFVAVVLLASKCSPRGDLRQSNGIPHTPETIARKTHLPASIIQEALSRCADSSVGWVEWVDDTSDVDGLFERSPNGTTSANGTANGTASADDCRRERQTGPIPSSGNGRGNGKELSSPLIGEGASEEGGKEAMRFTCESDEVWTLTVDHLNRLAVRWQDKVEVEPCLRDLCERMRDEPGLRKPAKDMPTYVQNWIGQDFRKYHNFLAAPSKDSSKGSAKSVEKKSAKCDVEAAAAALLRAS